MPCDWWHVKKIKAPSKWIKASTRPSLRLTWRMSSMQGAISGGGQTLIASGGTNQNWVFEITRKIDQPISKLFFFFTTNQKHARKRPQRARERSGLGRCRQKCKDASADLLVSGCCKDDQRAGGQNNTWPCQSKFCRKYLYIILFIRNHEHRGRLHICSKSMIQTPPNLQNSSCTRL